MKKIFTLSALLLAAAGVQADVITYDFTTNPTFCKNQKELGEMYQFVDKTGATTTDCQMLVESYMDGESKKWKAAEGCENLVISLVDGLTYTPDANGNYYNTDLETQEKIALDKTEPFICWGSRGPARTLWQPWGSMEKWDDKDYYTAAEADWAPTAGAIVFQRNDNSGNRGYTYIQFPEMSGTCAVSVWACSISDSNRSKEQDLRLTVIPVVNGVADEAQAQTFEKAYADLVNKRFYKTTFNFNLDGQVAFRIGGIDKCLSINRVEFNAEGAGVENVAVDAAAENAPIYNTLGVQVDENYKGLVIKGGKKYIQK